MVAGRHWLMGSKQLRADRTSGSITVAASLYRGGHRCPAPHTGDTASWRKLSTLTDEIDAEKIWAQGEIDVGDELSYIDHVSSDATAPPVTFCQASIH